MSDLNSWEKLDSAVASSMNPSLPIFERIKSLENEVYDQAFSLFGLVPLLCSQIDNSLCAEELVALRSLLNDTKRRLKILRKSEKKRKKSRQTRLSLGTLTKLVKMY